MYVSLQLNISFKKDAWEVARDMLVQEEIIIQPGISIMLHDRELVV